MKLRHTSNEGWRHEPGMFTHKVCPNGCGDTMAVAESPLREQRCDTCGFLEMHVGIVYGSADPAAHS